MAYLYKKFLLRKRYYRKCECNFSPPNMTNKSIIQKRFTVDIAALTVNPQSHQQTDVQCIDLEPRALAQHCIHL